MMLLMLLLSSLLAITTSTVYTVTPYDDDDHYYLNAMCLQCHHCHDLQYYLLNITKYFTSNTQLFFLPGIHHLHNDLIIQNVHNISLIGNLTNDTASWSIVNISQEVNIKIINSSIVTLKNFIIVSRAISFLHTINISLHNMIIDTTIIGDNVMGKSVLFNITSHKIVVTYDDDISVELNIHKLTICNCTIRKLCNIEMKQTLYEASIIIANSTFSKRRGEIITRVSITGSCTTPHENRITFDNIHFLNNFITNHIFYIDFRLRNDHCLNETIITHDKVFINNCHFANNSVSGIIDGQWYNEFEVDKIKQTIIIKNCVFANNIIGESILSFRSYYTEMNNAVYISGGKFLSNDCNSGALIIMSNITMQLKGPITFHVNTFRFLFNLMAGSFILFYDYMELLHNKGRYMIYASQVFLMQAVTFNITKNNISVLFFSKGSDLSKTFSNNIPLCYFQFYGNKILTSEIFEVLIRESDPSVIFNRNSENINCRMLPGSTFYEQNPLYVYRQFIHFQNELGNFSFPFNTGILCYCFKEQAQNCQTNTLGPVFPGQSLTIDLCINHRMKSSIKVSILPLKCNKNHTAKYLGQIKILTG